MWSIVHTLISFRYRSYSKLCNLSNRFFSQIQEKHLGALEWQVGGEHVCTLQWINQGFPGSYAWPLKVTLNKHKQLTECLFVLERPRIRL